MNRTLVILSVLVMMVNSSCNFSGKTSRKQSAIDSSMVSYYDSMIGPRAMQEQIEIADEPFAEVFNAKKLELIAALMPLWHREVHFRTFKGKAKMHYEGSGLQQEFTANIRIAKDSVIWIHVSAGMGIVNVARIYITPDSFRLVNYLSKSVINMHIAEAQAFLPAYVDFTVLQNLLIGEVLNRTGRPTDAAEFEAMWSLDITAPGVEQHINYNKADSNMHSQQVLSGQSGFAGMIRYGEYTEVDERRFSASRAININSNNEQHYLDMTFNNASFDEALDFPFSIPESYTLNK